MVSFTSLKYLVYGAVVASSLYNAPQAHAQKADAGSSSPTPMTDRHLYDQRKYEELVTRIFGRSVERVTRRCDKSPCNEKSPTEKLEESIDGARLFYAKLKVALEKNDERELENVLSYYDMNARGYWDSAIEGNFPTMLDFTNTLIPHEKDWYCSNMAGYSTIKYLRDFPHTRTTWNGRFYGAAIALRQAVGGGCKDENYRYFTPDGLFPKK